MPPADASLSVNGTLPDVASFFRVSERTVKRWINEVPPVISVWRLGGSVERARHLMFGEEAVIETAAAGFLASRRLQPGEAREIARREWREHLRRRQKAEGRRQNDELGELRGRLERIEARLRLAAPGLEPKVAA